MKKVFKMPIVRSRIRNSPHVLCTSILFGISVCAAFLLYYNHKIFTEVIDFKDLTSLYLLCFGVVTTVVLASIIHLVLLFHFEDFLSGEKSNILKKLWKHLNVHEYLFIIICLDIVGCFVLCWLYLYMGLKFNWGYLVVISSVSIIFACITIWSDYDEVELSSSQNMENSIGFAWAYGAYTAFYKIILADITRRIVTYEEKNDMTLLVKKLVIICPLSCNANGSLDNKDGYIKFHGNLETVIEDEGANNNRNLKTNVYKITEPYETYIAAEIPSPLATLYEMRAIMDPVILEYHRQCFVKSLQDLLRSDQCKCHILVYDDLRDSPEPLHRFLLRELEDKNFVSVIK